MTWNPTTPHTRPATRRLLAATLLAVVIAWGGDTVSTQATIDCGPVAGISMEVCEVSGRITADTTFDSGRLWLLSGAVFVDEPARLTIDAGTTILGESATNGTLVIARGAQIHANGTAYAPIVMTSDQEPGDRRRADWGGLIINGRAPLNVPGGEATGEGDTGVYGGNDPDDDSGQLYYLRVEFAGTEFSPDNELNGIAFQGVGRMTEVDHVMVKFNKDDGLEFFGGTVEVKHVICFGIADDSFDWTDGWQGKGQFMIALQVGDDADQGIEADNNGDNNDLEPRSNPTIYNLTLLGDPFSYPGQESDTGILLREGTAATIRNFIVAGFKEDAIDIDHAATFTQVDDGALTLESGILWGNCFVEGCDGQYRTDAEDPDGETTKTVVDASANMLIEDPANPDLAHPQIGGNAGCGYRCMFNMASPNFIPTDDSPAVMGTVAPATPPNDGFFEIANFIGAVGPMESAQSNWWIGWTDFSMN